MIACRSALFALVLLFCATAARAEAPTTIRVGEHDGFGRIVIDGQDGRNLHVVQAGSEIVIELPQPPALPARAPRNVVAISGDGTALHLAIKPGAVLRQFIVNQHLVLDIADPPKPDTARAEPRKTPPPQSKSATKPPPPAAPKPTESAVRPPPTETPPHEMPKDSTSPSRAVQAVETAAPPPPVQSPTQPPTQPSTQPVTPEAQAGPPAIVASLQEVPAAGAGHRLAVPFAANVGAASFRRGGEGVVVFDERKPIDLVSMKSDPVFGAASVQTLPNATLLRVPLPEGTELRLSRNKAGWQIDAIGGDATPAPLQPFDLMPANGVLHLPARQPGLVVSVPDPLTGGVILVGTQREAGQGLSVRRRMPDLDMLPSWLGVAIIAVSDQISMCVAADAFEIVAEPGSGGLSMSPPGPAMQQAASASRLTRLFDLPDEPPLALWHRYQAALRAAADAPPQSKAQARRGVAEAMLALGMAAEAQSVLNVAATADARALEDAPTQALFAAAAILAGRPSETKALDDHRLDGIDEIALWRALRSGVAGKLRDSDAQTLADLAPILESYPDALRDRLLPLAAESLVAIGRTEAAGTLLAQHPPTPALLLAKARQLVRAEKIDDAVKLYAELTQSSDRLVRAQAGRESVDLQLAQGRLTAAEAAQQLGKQLFSWRGDGRELDLRLHTASVMGQAGEWRAALQLLRETESDWPEQKERIHTQLTAMLADALRPDAQRQLGAIDAVALAEENADLIPDGVAGLAFADMIGERLHSLDLPEREMKFLEHMVASAPKSAARAEFGARLAKIRVAEGNPEEAVALLTATAAVELTPALLEQRGLVFADAMAAQHDFASARQTLLDLDTAVADRRRAELAEQAQDWPEAASAWKSLLQRTLPGAGTLDVAGEQLAVRLVAAAARSGDSALLARLRSELLPRLSKGENANMVDFLTSGKPMQPGELGLGGKPAPAGRSAPSG